MTQLCSAVRRAAFVLAATVLPAAASAQGSQPMMTAVRIPAVAHIRARLAPVVARGASHGAPVVTQALVVGANVRFAVVLAGLDAANGLDASELARLRVRDESGRWTALGGTIVVGRGERGGEVRVELALRLDGASAREAARLVTLADRLSLQAVPQAALSVAGTGAAAPESAAGAL